MVDNAPSREKFKFYVRSRMWKSTIEFREAIFGFNMSEEIRKTVKKSEKVLKNQNYKMNRTEFCRISKRVQTQPTA